MRSDSSQPAGAPPAHSSRSGEAPPASTHPGNRENTDHLGFGHPQSAFRSPVAHLWLWSMAAGGIAVDLWSKDWAFRTLDPTEGRAWIPHLLEFQLSLNAGALFGIGSGKATLFIAASLAALLFVVYLFAGTSRRQRGVHIALGLILAGAGGNLYDRATYRYDRVVLSGDRPAMIGQVASASDEASVVVTPWFAPDQTYRYDRDELAEPVRQVGVVRDFLHFTPRIGGRAIWPWVFNVADALLVVGVLLLLIGFWRQARVTARSANPADAPVPSG
jgi:lipoprotein signal peptidase